MGGLKQLTSHVEILECSIERKEPENVTTPYHVCRSNVHKFTRGSEKDFSAVQSVYCFYRGPELGS